MMTDVRKYGIDIFVGTGHKVMSDTGIGFFAAKTLSIKSNAIISPNPNASIPAQLITLFIAIS